MTFDAGGAGEDHVHVSANISLGDKFLANFEFVNFRNQDGLSAFIVGHVGKQWAGFQNGRVDLHGNNLVETDQADLCHDDGCDQQISKNGNQHGQCCQCAELRHDGKIR